MRYAIFSDVHSNLSAFSNVLDYFKKQNIDKYVFVGDIVGYYTDINECIYSLRNLNPNLCCRKSRLGCYWKI